MDKFEEYIKARYPVDYEHLKEKYPNVPVGEFYGDEKDLWNYRQAELEEKDKWIKQALSELESLHNKKWAEWKEQADMHSQGEANAYEHAMQILDKVLRGEHE
ncbi:MAG: hypothetical protein I4N51_09040 [Acinetobacter sp.]|nr:hypothetical protein [Acinetobacter sp.]